MREVRQFLLKAAIEQTIEVPSFTAFISAVWDCVDEERKAYSVALCGIVDLNEENLVPVRVYLIAEGQPCADDLDMCEYVGNVLVPGDAGTTLRLHVFVRDRIA